MRNTILTVFGILLFLSCSSQTATDSTQMKLQQYKQWLDMGLIDKPEYDLLKGKIIKTEISEKVETGAQDKKDVSSEPKIVYVDRLSKRDTMNLSDLRSKSNAGIGIGSFLTAAGTGLLLGSGIRSSIPIPDNLSLQDYSRAISDKRGTVTGLAIAGAIGLVNGIVWVCIGAKDRRVYLDRKQSEVYMQVSPTELTISF